MNLLKKILFFEAICLLLLVSISCKEEAIVKFDVDLMLENSASQYTYMKSKLNGQNVFPKTYMSSVDSLITSPSDWWCSGFYPGTLFYLYEQTGNKDLYAEGTRMLGLLEKEQFNIDTHDIGFMINCSYGNANRITPNKDYKDIIVNSAKSLITRFNPVVGCIKSHNGGENDFVVIIDNMMNLELLFNATELTGDSTYYNIAVTHANTTMKNHFRADNSLYHALNYDPKTGKVKSYLAGQGYSEQSAWSRGQAWGLYGYTMVYRFTRQQKYLDQAIKIAKFQFDDSKIPENMIPYWDFNAPDIPTALRDASAAAINCSALLELSQYVSNDLSKKYVESAEKILSTLSTSYYTAPVGTNGGFILKHSVGNMPAKTEIDVPLSYADYYYVEALTRYKSLIKK